MNLWDNGLCSVIPVSIHRQQLPIVVQQNIVHTPCIDGQTLYLRVTGKCFPNAVPNLLLQCCNIPYQMSLFCVDSVGEAVHFLRLQGISLAPANNMPAGRSTNIDCQIIAHKKASFS